MYEANAIGDIAGLECIEKNGIRIGVETRGDVKGLEGAKGKVNITMPNKINKTLLLVSY